MTRDEQDDDDDDYTPTKTETPDQKADEDEEAPFDAETNPYLGVRSATMVVEKVYKGNVKVGDELVFGQGTGSNCVYYYSEKSIGERRLLYLDSPTRGYREDEENPEIPLRHYEAYCGRNGGVEGAIDDLAYLNNLKRVKGRTRVSGVLSDYHENGPSVANVKIKIIGKNKTYETRTGKTGFYEIYDLPPGDYLLEPQIQKGWTVDDSHLSDYLMPFGRMNLSVKNRVPVKLKEKRHTGVDLEFTYDNSIHGKIISPDGKPMKGVYVTASSSPERDGSTWAQTNEKGEYKMDKLYPGNYYLLVNPDGKRDAEQAFGKLFYPGVSDPKQAGIVSVEAGSFLNNINIQIPALLDLVDVAGRLLYADDKSAVNDEVVFVSEQADAYRDARVKTDENGRFLLRLPKGATGKIIGRIYGYSPDGKTCPELMDLMRSQGNSTVTSNVFAISANDNIPDVELRISTPFCKEARK